MKGIVNQITGKIIGVKEGTREYYHEKGHLEYQDSNDGMRNDYIRGVLLNIFFVAILLPFLHKALIFVPGILILGYTLLGLYEEQWCWRYADRKMLECNEVVEVEDGQK